MNTADFSTGSGTTYQGDAEQGGAQEKAQQVAGTAADETKKVASTARDEAQNVAAEARAQVKNLMSEASSQLDDQSRTQKERLAGTMRTFGDDLEQMATDQTGLASDVAREVADRARSLSSHLEGREPRELLDDVRGFARRRPGTFLLGALAAGVVAGRVTRVARAAQSEAPEATAGTGTDMGVTGSTSFPPVVADVTSPADPLSSGAAAPSSGPASGGLDEPGTASGDPLSGTWTEHTDPTYPAAAPEPDAPWSDQGSRP